MSIFQEQLHIMNFGNRPFATLIVHYKNSVQAVDLSKSSYLNFILVNEIKWIEWTEALG